MNTLWFFKGNLLYITCNLIMILVLDGYHEVAKNSNQQKILHTSSAANSSNLQSI